MLDFLESLSYYPALYVPIFGVVGLVVGSFLNVVIYRLPKMMEADWRQDARAYLGLPAEQSENFNLAVPASTCPGCARQIRVWENIPVLSYLVLRGRCAGCSGKVSLRYPIVELLGAGAGVVAGLYFGLSLQGAAMAVVFWMLIAIAFIDHDTMFIPDVLSQPLLWAGLLFVACASPALLAEHVIGAAVGYLILRVLPIGDGDAKFAGACGAWLGWTALPFFMTCAAFLGAIVGAVFFLKRGESRPYPFGPSLAVGFVLSVFYGEKYATYLGII
jgi:leader peptidase (prepilin peptidase)/N-methyltransferase